MSGWPKRALGTVAMIERRGRTPEQIADGTKYLGLENIDRGGNINGYQTIGEVSVASTKFVFSGRHVLFGKLRPNLGKIARPEIDGVCSTDILPVLPGPELDRAYLTHFLRQPHMVEFAASRAAGANLPRLSPTELAKFLIPMPPIEEQRRIAAILDQSDELRSKRRETIALLDDLTQSFFIDMFGNPVSNPSGWPSLRLEQVCSKVTDGEHQTPKRSETGFPLLSARNVQNGRLDMTNVDHVGAEEYQRIVRRIEPRMNDILISCSGTIGRVARVVSEMRFAMVRSVAIVRPIKGIDPVFLEHALRNSHSKRLMVSRANSSAQANLFQNQIRALPMIAPPLSLQVEFASKVAFLNELAAKTLKADAAGSQLIESIRARAFSGQL